MSYDPYEERSAKYLNAAKKFGKWSALALVVGFLLVPHENLRADIGAALITVGIVAGVVALAVAFIRWIECL